MITYRISQKKFADDLSGTGAKLFGGRWNHIDIPCIYTSESRALATLEYSVNVNIEHMPTDLCLITFEFSDKLVHPIEENEIPGNWQAIPAPLSTKDLGSKLLRKNVAVIRVPSVVVADEYNYILNTSTQKFKLLEVQHFSFDLRIKYS